MSQLGARGAPALPPVLLGAGAVTDVRALTRFGDLTGVPVPVGPVEAGSRRTRPGRPHVHRLGVGGIEHDDLRAISLSAARERLSWAATRDLSAWLTVRTGSGEGGTDLAAVVEQLHRGVDGDALVAVEVDLRGADDQQVLRAMARVREAAPRDQLLLARLSALDSRLVANARAAVAGGAGAIVMAAQVPLGPGRWWSGASTTSLTLAGVRALRKAAADQRWPGAALVAAGGIHGPASALEARAAGADTVELGTALWADPTLLWTVRDALLGSAGPGHPGHPHQHVPHPAPRRRSR